MKKIFIFLLSLFICLPIANAVSDVNYDVEEILIDATLDKIGNLNVKEIIVLDGSFNGYIRDLVYKNYNLDRFDGTKESFYQSDIYNGSSIELIKVGKINYNKNDDFDNFNNNITTFYQGYGYPGDSGVYELSYLSNGLSIKMFNETYKSTTAFYIEYIIEDVAVLHNDVAEIYYNFIGENFDDDIKNIEIRVKLSEITNGEVRVWAHGPLNGEVDIYKENGMNYGVIASIQDLDKNTPVDIRMTYPKELNNSTKTSGIDALDYILEVETERADEANRQRAYYKTIVIACAVFTGLYLAGLVYLSLTAYKKHDKEHKSEFNNEYNREIIEDYDVPIVEYIMDKNITSNAFSAQIMNLIYKKKISVEKDEKKKNNYTFKRINEENINPNESKIMKLLFDEIGKNNTVTSKEITKYSKITSSSGNNEFLNNFNLWKNSVIADAKKEAFYEKNSKKTLYILYGVLGFIVAYLDIIVLESAIAFFVVGIVSLVYLIYIVTIRKRTVKGNEHYVRWKAFKNFLLDFGRFEEKDLPEIILWEKYLVYATVLGVADKVSKAMQVKLDSMPNASYTAGDFVFDYYLYTSLSRDLNRTISRSYSSAVSAVNAARSRNSSGGGFGGGFSGGGGFGGGGGGGRGF